jgi:hypothetical protein
VIGQAVTDFHAVTRTHWFCHRFFDENLSLNKVVAVVLIVLGLAVDLYGQRILRRLSGRTLQSQ